MLTDLYLLQTYFEESVACIYEDDLIARYGQDAVNAAIESGLIEQRRMPCRHRAAGRCICRLSQAGILAVQNHIRACSSH